MKKVLTIAGSDCSGGAGIQADLKTIGAFGLYGMSVISAITVQNTQGVHAVRVLEEDIVEAQFRAVLEDLFPDAIKIGMVASRGNIHAIVSVLREYKEAGRKMPYVVLDPVMISTSGKELLDSEAFEALIGELFPLVDLITPNLPEASRLCGFCILSDKEREDAARELARQYECSVLIKGGHGSRADDLLYDFISGKCTWYKNEKIKNDNTHGTGCTLSSAIACGMARGKELEESICEAKRYITGAISDGMNLGKGNGPLNHFYNMKSEMHL